MKCKMASDVTLNLLLATVIVGIAHGTVQGETIVGREGRLRLSTDAGYNNTAEEHFAPRFKQDIPFQKMGIKPAGDSLIIRCDAEGNPTPNITWYKNKITRIWRDHFQPYSEWSLYLDNPTKADSGNYTCVVCNELGCIDHTMELRVLGLSFLEYWIPVNETVRIKCPVMPDLKSRIKYWGYFKNDGKLEAKQRISQNLEDKPEHLTIYNVSEEDEGIYWCKINDYESGYPYKYIRLKVFEQRYCSRYLENDDIWSPVNGTVTMKCPLKPEPKLKIIWYKHKTPEGWVLAKGLTPEDKPEQLTIFNVSKEDEGRYLCVQINNNQIIKNMSRVNCAFIELRLFEQRYCSRYLENDDIWSPVNGTVTMKCPLKPEPKLKIIWYKHKTPEGWVLAKSLTPEDKPEQLTIFNVSKEDEGRYLCVQIDNNQIIKNMSRVNCAFIELRLFELQTLESSEVNMAVIITLTVVLVVGIIVIGTFIILKRAKKRQFNDSPSTHVYDIPLRAPVDTLNHWEVPRENLLLGRVLGEGEFGRVVKAECVETRIGRQSTVAVKMLKENHTDAEMKALVSEMEIMKIVGQHKNIVNLLGCCTQNGPLLVIVEFALHGSLREFLRNNRPEKSKKLPTNDLEQNILLTQIDLVSFSYQVAQGMEYLASRQCIHRDLAARNVLVSKDYVLKIADFGLARDVVIKDYYRKTTGGKLPARWMAPESLSKMLFTVQTDVWSFGVLMWEIMTVGAMPYHNVPGYDLYQYLRAGHRLKIPPSCRHDIYMLMRDCWSSCPEDRPSFTQLVEDLDKILSVITNQDYLNLNLLHIDNLPG